MKSIKLADLLDLFVLYEKVMIRPVDKYRDPDQYDFIGNVKEFRNSELFGKLSTREVYSIHATNWNCICIGIEED